MNKKNMFLSVVGFVTLSASAPAFSMGIFEAIGTGDSHKIKNLVSDKKVDFNYVRNQAGKTPFFYACQCGNLEAIKLLLPDCTIETINEAHGRIIFDEKFKETPLYLACIHNKLDIAKLLLQNGANITGNEPEKPRINPYLALVRDYDLAKNKMEFILKNKNNKVAFEFLVKLAFGRSLGELENNKLKSPFDTVLFSLYINEEINNLVEIFGVPTKSSFSDFIEKAAEKKCFRINKSLTKKSEKENFFVNLQKHRSKKFRDLVVTFE
jgi:hypothetical protein